MIGIDHWIIEIGIVLLGLWAVWKSLPRDPDIHWVQFQENVVRGLIGEPIHEPMSPKPFTLLEWTDIASDSERRQDYVRKRLMDWIVVGTDALVHGWHESISIQTLSVDWSNSTDVLDRLEKRLTERSQRFVFVTSAIDCDQLIQFLHANPPVRDFTGAVVLLEPELQTEWMQEHFNNKEMDVEANVSVPYFVCQTEGVSFQFMPPVSESGWKAIDVIQCDPIAHQWFQEQNSMWVELLSMLMVKRKESV